MKLFKNRIVLGIFCIAVSLIMQYSFQQIDAVMDEIDGIRRWLYSCDE